MRLFGLSISLMAMMALTGCQLFGVYRIDVPQGTPITQQMASQVSVGMTQEQVLSVLGSPALRDTLTPNRWDYVYDYTAGTDGRRQGKTNVKANERRFSVYFDQAGRVTDVQGLQNLPYGR